MNVAIVVKEFPPDVIGGTETQTLRMAHELQTRTDHDVTVYTKAYPGPESHDPPFELVRVPNLRTSDVVSTLTFVLVCFVSLLRDSRRIDVLHCMMIYPTGFVGYVVSTLTRVPYFAWIRGGDYYFMKENPVKRWTIDRVLRDTVVLAQADNVRCDVEREFAPRDIRVIGNGVDLPDVVADGDHLVFVGRLKAQKGVEYLIRAVGSADVDTPVLVVGDGPERDSLESLADELGVDATFVGEVPPERVTEYLCRGAFFVLPSIRGEGLPNALLEAMAVGLPVVATDLAGIGDVIEHGETGYVVEPGNVEELSERIRALSHDETARRRMGDAAREYVTERHSWAAITAEIDALYRELATDR
jgi:glycosyltransferase involved in cell wall biosynthesis